MGFCVEGLREEIVVAFAVPIRGRSTTDYADNSSPRFKNKPKRQIEIDEVTTVEIEVQPIRGAMGRRFMTASMPLLDNAFTCARMVRAINQLDDISRHWVHYAYKDGTDWEAITALTHYCYGLFKALNTEKLTPKTLKEIEALVFLALQNVRHEVREGQPRHKPQDVRELAGKKPDTWKKHWASRWASLNAIYRELDYKALDALKHVKR